MSACSVIAVPWNCTGVYVSCHCSARLSDGVALIKDKLQAKADAIGQCMDALSGQPQPHEDEAMTDPCEDICSAKGKGTPLRVPGLGQEDGPMWMYGGGPTGWKVLIEHLPSNVSDATIGNYCDGQVHICVLSHNPRSRIASALVTFGDLPQAIKAFEQLAMATFNDAGEMRRATVKWFRKP